MNGKEQEVKRIGQAEDPETMEPELREALGDFKLSVDAWSDSMMSRPREAKPPAHSNWVAVNKWVLGCMVFAGTVSSALYENHKQVEAARIEAARMAEQRIQGATNPAKVDEESLMADVDNDVARQVPSALEPMATLMAEDEIKGN